MTTERSHDDRITKLEQALIGVTTTVQVCDRTANIYIVLVPCQQGNKIIHSSQDVNIRVGSIADQIASQDLRKEVQNILNLLGPFGNAPAPNPLADGEGCLCGRHNLNNTNPLP